MARTIVVDPSKLESASQKMDSQSAEYEKLYNQLFNEVDGMAANWKGADNVAFVSQIKGFQDDFQKMKQLMNQYSEFLKNSAKTYRETQNETINQAKRLTN
ncbi:WXG100 family type VII secretion target [Cohnella cholangitidis]|uniref:ESAT-6-like protein n=1 Tax=Cohnella cholangitidis TaxID=2598458 RepID=A0A7G5BU54_9BACL|nr:WXG100 family type VII secretion target [Cohnella cholangitidis]QMV40488.1 WXG100 family type VII secretion target [Cohnella cholangitidis]